MSDIIATGFNAGSDNDEISPSSRTAKLMCCLNTDVRQSNFELIVPSITPLRSIAVHSLPARSWRQIFLSRQQSRRHSPVSFRA